jgi:chromate transporter
VNGQAALLPLAGHLAILSIVSFGGIPAVLPDIHKLVVEGDRLLTNREFADFFAISQMMPGPNFIFMLSLVGWKIAGLPGALVTAAAISGPSSTATFLVFGCGTGFATRRGGGSRDAAWCR